MQYCGQHLVLHDASRRLPYNVADVGDDIRGNCIDSPVNRTLVILGALKLRYSNRLAIL